MHIYCVVFLNNMYQINHAKTFMNSFSTIQDKCCLFAYFGSLYCIQFGPKSDFSLRISLIRFHSVCFHGKSILNWSRCNKQKTF